MRPRGQGHEARKGGDAEEVPGLGCTSRPVMKKDA